jgi:G3E family GTPase
MNSGCICCSLVGDFAEALKKVLDEYHPDRILIEPSGVGKLSDVIRAVHGVESEDAKLNSFTAVCDASKCKMYMKNFGEFYNDQVENASAIIMSHTGGMSEEKIAKAFELLREKNANAVIVTTPWDELDGKQLLEAIEGNDTLKSDIEELLHHHKHHHHHHDDDEECCCGHHHDHEHHHHDDDEECCCGHHHDHEHHHHHHADEVFTSCGYETTKRFTADEIKNVLSELEKEETYGMILRAKGIVAGEDGKWIHFDYVPGEPDVRYGASGITGRLCVIGAKIDEEKIKSLFGV